MDDALGGPMVEEYSGTAHAPQDFLRLTMYTGLYSCRKQPHCCNEARSAHPNRASFVRCKLQIVPADAVWEADIPKGWPGQWVQVQSGGRLSTYDAGP